MPDTEGDQPQFVLADGVPEDVKDYGNVYARGVHQHRRSYPKATVAAGAGWRKLRHLDVADRDGQAAPGRNCHSVKGRRKATLNASTLDCRQVAPDRADRALDRDVGTDLLGLEATAAGELRRADVSELASAVLSDPSRAHAGPHTRVDLRARAAVVRSLSGKTRKVAGAQIDRCGDRLLGRGACAAP